MSSRLRHLHDDERGMSMMFVGVGFLAFFTATAMSIEVGMYMNARSQAQNAADAAAHAGAVALVIDDYDNRSAGGPAVQSAINAALENQVMQADVSVTADDVTFPAGPDGQFNRVRVRVHRTAARSNPVLSLLGSFIDIDSVDVSAEATAEASPTMALTCVRPFTIPDRWVENSVPPNDTFERYDNRGNLLPNADYYPDPERDPTTYRQIRYDSNDDKGTLLVLRAGSGNNIAPTMYYSWNMPGGDIGGDYYEENIRLCNQVVVEDGFVMTQEPGNMMGPTISGIENLIAQDPTAYWDGQVVRSPLGSSPRIFPIPLYNPDVFDNGKQTGRNASLIVSNWVGFFVEDVSGNEVYGRIVPIIGTVDPDAGPAPENAFARVIRLVE